MRHVRVAILNVGEQSRDDMLVQSVGDATGSVYGGLGQRWLVEEHVHKIAKESRCRASVVIACIKVVHAYENIVAGY